MTLELFVDKPHLWVIGFKLDDAGKPTWTQGWRFTSDKLEPAGSFEGEGRTDYNTIDLDEE